MNAKSYSMLALIVCAGWLLHGCAMLNDLDDDTDSAGGETDGSDSEASPTDGNDTADTDGSDSTNDSSHPSVAELSAMTWAQIEDYARTHPLASGECDDEGSQCVVSFLDAPICLADGHLITPQGSCDETGDGYFCSPNMQNCFGEAVLRCNEVAENHFELMVSAGQCVVGDEGPMCAVSEEQLLMDCNDLIGVRICDADYSGVRIATEAGCREERDANSESNQSWRGCFVSASTPEGVCDTDEWCFEDWVTVVFPQAEFVLDDEYEGDAPRLWYTDDAQCEFCENMHEGYCYPPLLD